MWLPSTRRTFISSVMMPGADDVPPWMLVVPPSMVRALQPWGSRTMRSEMPVELPPPARRTTAAALLEVVPKPMARAKNVCLLLRT